jgi:hypothetical protein
MRYFLTINVQIDLGRRRMMQVGLQRDAPRLELVPLVVPPVNQRHHRQRRHAHAQQHPHQDKGEGGH